MFAKHKYPTRTTSNKKPATKAVETKLDNKETVVTLSLTVDTEETTAKLPPLKPASSPNTTSNTKTSDERNNSSSSKSDDNFFNILSKFSLSGDASDDHKKHHELTSSTVDYKNLLEQRLSSLLVSTKNTAEADDLYEIGSLYLKLARLDDIKHLDSDALTKRNSALKSLTQALEKCPADNFSDKALYLATKAKCLFHMDLFDEAESVAQISLTKKSNGLAYETLGDVYRSKGQYRDSLNAFKQSLEVDYAYKLEHKIVCLYNQSIVQAALGDKDLALRTFTKANSKSYDPKKIDDEDRMLIIEMRKPEYANHIIQLAEIASSARMRSVSETAQPEVINQHQTSINNVVNTISPGTKAQMDDDFLRKLQTLQDRILAMEETVAKERSSHLDDKEKLDAVLETINLSKQENIDEKTIKQNPYLFQYYNKIQDIILNEYIVSSIVETGRVSDSSRGLLGWLGLGVRQIGDNAIPPVAKIIVKGAAAGLEAADEAKKALKNQNYKAIATNQREMQDLAKEVATYLTLQLDEKLTSDERSNYKTKDRKQIKTIKNQADEEAIKICDFIKSIIFDGRISGNDINEKANMIIALIKIDQDHQQHITQDLPEYTLNISSTALVNIKFFHLEQKYYWKENLYLEDIFKKYLASAVNKVNEEQITDHEMFAEKLATNISEDRDVITIERRTFAKWQWKAKLSDSFLCSTKYFDPHVEKLGLEKTMLQIDTTQEALSDIDLHHINVSITTSPTEEGTDTAHHIGLGIGIDNNDVVIAGESTEI